MKKTVIVGSSENPSRYSNLVSHILHQKEIEFVPLGIKNGVILGKEILNIASHPFIKDVDTITLYIGKEAQKNYYDYLLSLKPKRIIFNPGTENSEFFDLADKAGIEVMEACTLVMLKTNQY